MYRHGLAFLALLCATLLPPPGALASPSRRSRQAQHEHARAPSGAEQRAQRLGLGTRAAAGALLAGRVEARWIQAAGGDRAPGTLRFPVTKGWYVRGFGSGTNGYHQAMDIGGEVGWNVRAAAHGIVGYAGDELEGYGNLVVVVHPGGWVTAYAHNAKNLVVAGQRVSRGNVIAELGSTGRSRGPHVHFELLVAGENCDPAPLFRPDVKHRSGRALRVERATWRSPRRRPESVLCHARKHHPDHLRKGDDASDDEREDEPEESLESALAL